MPTRPERDGPLPFRKRLRNAVLGVVIAIICLPLAVLATLFGAPLWNRFEAATGIESYSHSGPAEWCYLAVYLVLVVLAGLAWSRLRRHRRTHHNRQT